MAEISSKVISGEIGIIVVEDRAFVVIKDGKEVDVCPHKIKDGELFCVYSGRDKKTTCFWGDATVFRRTGRMYSNNDHVLFMPCIPMA